MSLQDNIKNGLLTGGGILGFSSRNQPAEYKDRAHPYFSDATRAFVEERAQYASDFFTAKTVGLDPNDPLREISVQKQTSYILSIVKNTSLMYLRQRHSENCYLVDDERILDCAATSQDDLDAALISEAESQVIRQALKRLKPRDRDLLEMKYFSQLDDKKISQQLRISRNSVRYYLTLARRALKDEIKKGDSSHV